MDGPDSKWRQYTEVMLKIVALYAFMQLVNHLSYAGSFYLQLLDMVDRSTGTQSDRPMWYKAAAVFGPGLMLAIPAVTLLFGSKRVAVWLSPAPDVFESDRQRIFLLAVQGLGFFFLINALCQAAISSSGIAMSSVLVVSVRRVPQNYDLMRFVGPAVRIFAGAILAFEGHRIVAYAFSNQVESEEETSKSDQMKDQRAASDLLFCGIGLYLAISGASGIVQELLGRAGIFSLRWTSDGVSKLIPAGNLIKVVTGVFLFLRPAGISRFYWWLRRFGYDKHPAADEPDDPPQDS